MLYASEVARMIGISRTRVERLAYEGRIVEPRKVYGRWRMLPISKSGQAWQIPENFRVLPSGRPRPGPLTDFIERWEAEHPEIMAQMERDRLLALSKAEWEARRNEVAKRIKRNAPHGSKTAFFAPQI